MRWLGWLMLFLVPFFVLAVLHWTWSPSTSAGDYAQYLLHAKALVEGRPYNEVGYIYQQAAGLIGPPSLPPGLPLTLAPIVALGGVHSPLVRLLMLGSALLFAVLAAWRLSRDVEPWQAAFGGAIAAYAIEAALGTVAPISDPGFAALIWATVVVVDREGAWTWRRVVLVTALGFAAIAYRTVGIALIPGLLLYALFQRRRLGPLPFAPAALWLGVGVVALVLGLATVPFVDRVFRSLGNLAEHLDTFQRQYRLALFDSLLYPFASNRANDLYHAIAAIPTFVGLVIVVRRAWRSFMVTFALGYGLLLLVAPVAEPRYAWPLFPILAAAFAHGTTTIVQRMARGLRPVTVRWIAATSLVAVMLVTLARDVRRPAPAAFVRHPDAIALMAWLAAERGRAPADAPPRVAYFNPRVLTLESGVAAMGIVPRTLPGMFAAMNRERATHFVWQGAPIGDSTNSVPVPCVQRMANRLPDLHPGSFTLAYSNPTFRVYRFSPRADATQDNGERISWSECQ
jgi:hypothetical protein